MGEPTAVEATPPVDTSWITYETEPSGLVYLLAIVAVLTGALLLTAASSIWLVLR